MLKLLSKETKRLTNFNLTIKDIEYKNLIFHGYIPIIIGYCKKLFNFCSEEIKQREDFEIIKEFLVAINDNQDIK